MSFLLSPTQRRHFDETQRLFFNDQARALRNDPEIAEAMELGMLDHLYKGWKHLVPRKGKNGEQLKGYALINDDPIEIDPAEQIQFLIDETDQMIRQGEKAGAFKTMRPEDREYVRQAILKHIYSGSITGDSIAALGTKGRNYPVSYEDASLAGKPIKAQWQAGQRGDRGMQVLLDRAELVDVDTGVGIHGQRLDALHREAAANNPALLTATSNMRPGGASLNRAVGNLTGDELQSTLKNRKSSLRDKQFLFENGIPAKQRGGIDKRTNAENRAQMALERKIDEIIKTIGAEELRAYANDMSRSARNISTEDQGKAINVFADTVLMGKGINGNGRQRK